jgi:cytochrome P450
MSACTAGTGEMEFDPELLRKNTISDRLFHWLLGPPSFAGFALMRRLRPNLRLKTTVIASRRQDVEWVLSQPDRFEVRLSARMASLRSPPLATFGLGTDGNAYADSLRLSSKGVRLGDAEQIANALRGYMAPNAPGPSVDVAALARNTQARLARDYLGLAVTDDELPDLALRILAVANYALGAQAITTNDGRAALGAATRLYDILRRAIESPRPDTVTGRLVASGASADTIEATLAGLAVALLAAPTLAITNIAQVLLQRPEALDAARAAIQAGDDPRLHRVLLEALRFQPISPGPVRFCTTDTTIAAGTFRQCRAKAGDTVIAATQSAMFDPGAVQRPGEFDPDRAPEESLVFGFGRHTCLGFMLGRVQIAETLRPLLRRGFSQTSAQRRAVTSFGLFRENFNVWLG